MQKKFLLTLGIITIISIVLILTLIEVRTVRSGPQTPTSTPNALTPFDPDLLPVMPTAIQPEVVDLAPQIPYEDKPSVVVQHPDGSRTMYLVAPDNIDAFIENLPEGDVLKLVLSPPSMLGSGEPPTSEP